MLTLKQSQVVRFAATRASDAAQFYAFVNDATAGRRVSEQELRQIVDTALRIDRLPYRHSTLVRSRPAQSK
jgi:hypothetical protein